jgi:dTDP-4-amino-4,6-dideoxygalactose transaminase
MVADSSSRILLSPPHMGGHEWQYLKEAFQSNWIAPVGPFIERFERRFAEYLGVKHAVAVSTGTAALHLALRLLEIQPGDEVFCSDFTFIASVSSVVHERATPVFIDSEPRTWNMDPALLVQILADRARRRKLPRAVIVVHLYGQPADLDPIATACAEYGVPLIEDAAESLGATYRGRHTGTFGQMATFSFNGNKIITTSGGGMFVSNDANLAERARYLATQARQPVPHYEHWDVGYNYRLSNLLAAIGLGQMDVLDQRVQERRSIAMYYQEHLADVSGITFMPEPEFVRASRWLTCILVDPQAYGEDTNALRLRLEKANIESRPLWKPMHLQPVFKGCDTVGGGRVCEGYFARGLCLPSGTGMTRSDLERIVSVIRKDNFLRRARRVRSASIAGLVVPPTRASGIARPATSSTSAATEPSLTSASSKEA